MEKPENARDAMDIVLDWIKRAADVSFRHQEGKKCLDEFDRGNWELFKCYFEQGDWDKSKHNLRRAATLHGILTTIYTLEYDPARTEAHFDSFVKAGLQVREICGVHLEAVLHARGISPTPSPCQGSIKGQWCSWPSR